MRKLALTAVLIAAFASATWAHIGDELIYIYELTDEDLIRIDLHDGSVNDWQDLIGEPSIIASRLPMSSNPPGAEYDSFNFDFRIWLGWHKDTSRFYVAMERSDDIYVNEFKWGTVSDGSFSQHDSGIVFAVDGDHSGGVFIPEADTFDEREMAANQQAQWYEAIAELLGEGPQLRLQYFSPRSPWFMEPPFAEGGGRVFDEVPTLSVTEFYVTAFDFLAKDDPEASQLSILVPGEVVGIRIGVTDWDIGNRVKGSSITFSGFAKHDFPSPVLDLEYFTSADFFGDALLVGKDKKIPGVTAVESTSWARIKASFGE